MYLLRVSPGTLAELSQRSTNQMSTILPVSMLSFQHSHIHILDVKDFLSQEQNLV